MFVRYANSEYAMNNICIGYQTDSAIPEENYVVVKLVASSSWAAFDMRWLRNKQWESVTRP
jgi:hypothetical protein